MCLVCEDTKTIWKEGVGGALVIAPCPYCNKPKGGKV